MDGRRQFLVTRFVLVIALLANSAVSTHADGIEGLKLLFTRDDQPLTLKEVAYLVDCIDQKLSCTGTIGVKSPSVWGQNRMTRYRAEYESQMAQNLNQFQLILQAAQRRSDTAVLTSATSLAATVAAKGAATPRGPLGGGSTAAAVVPITGSTAPSSAAGQPQQAITINTVGSGTASSAGGSGSSGSGGSSSSAPSATDPTALLSDISAKLAALQNGLLPLPQNISNFFTKTGQTGVGLEPTLQLDEEGTYINHLHQLRRVNAGDDSTDLAGYGLYLMRMPITLMPGPESRKGKGAIVTMEARHLLTNDLLENTLRDVVVLDVTYALTQIINEELHRHICMKCAPHKKEATKANMTALGQTQTEVQQVANVQALPDLKGILRDDCDDDEDEDDLLDAEQRSLIGGLKTGAGPNAVRLQDLRIILGSDCWPAPLNIAEGVDEAEAAAPAPHVQQREEGAKPDTKSGDKTGCR